MAIKTNTFDPLTINPQLITLNKKNQTFRSGFPFIQSLVLQTRIKLLLVLLEEGFECHRHDKTGYRSNRSQYNSFKNIFRMQIRQHAQKRASRCTHKGMVTAHHLPVCQAGLSLSRVEPVPSLSKDRGIEALSLTLLVLWEEEAPRQG